VFFSRFVREIFAHKGEKQENRVKNCQKWPKAGLFAGSRILALTLLKKPANRANTGNLLVAVRASWPKITKLL
jgi:hypothetical protein